MPRARAQASKGSRFNDSGKLYLYGTQDPKAVRTAELLEFIASYPGDLIKECALGEPQDPEVMLLHSFKASTWDVSASGALAEIFFQKDQPAIGVALNDLVVLLLEAVQRKEAKFFRDLGASLNDDRSPADPLRFALRLLALFAAKPGETLVESLSRIPPDRIRKHIKEQGVPVTDRAIRDALQKITGKRGKPGRPKKR